MQQFFSSISRKTAEIMGTPPAFFVALLVIALWALSGRYFNFSDTWQLIINTGTTIITFLMVILIQNTQNHDSHAIHLKLDELIRAVKGARNDLLSLETMSDEQLQALQKDFEGFREEAIRRKNQTKT